MRYLTKSRFKIGLDCPTKLYYTGKDNYSDSSEGDTFLESLAEGGYQVGELAKCYFPGGNDITERGYKTPLDKTNELLQQENVIIYEAAIKYQNLFIRADILKKEGNNIELIEVKAKSFGGKDYKDFLNNKGAISGGWKTYLYDVAFQKYVIKKAFPDWNVKGFLMLADKNAAATVNGLNQKFQLRTNDEDRTYVEIIGGASMEELGDPVLIQVNVDPIIDPLISSSDIKLREDLSFVDYIKFLADHYEKDKKIIEPIGTHCAGCEFRASSEQESDGMISGFKECWKEQLHWADDQFEKPFIFDIWNFRRKNHLFEEGIYHLDEVQKEHIGSIAPNNDGSLSTKERQWLQIEKYQNGDTDPYIDTNGLKKELDSFTYPLHFIDFETSMVAIPFYKGRKPYEQTAFQFSHHVVYEDGKIEHKGQYLCQEKGKFPNYDFVKELKAELENDEGTIFRYAAHENTVLNQILDQLKEEDSIRVPDKKELTDFIQSITHGANHCGNRDMVDMLDLVKKYYYHPDMGGSNSIKAVLPAVLSSSNYIQKKYSKPIYGKNSKIKSLNFDDGWIWIKKDENGKVISPYKLLPNLHEGLDPDKVEEYFYGDKLADGGAAMTAYAKMQFMRISDEERNAIANGLLKYCELDTMAMVFIWEYWKTIVQ